MPDELKPCPFCGSTDLEWSNLGENDDWYVCCKSCDIQQIANYTKQVAFERWNNRPDLSPIVLVQPGPALTAGKSDNLSSVVDLPNPPVDRKLLALLGCHEALNAWEHWYSEDSTEDKRDTAREMGLTAMACARGESVYSIRSVAEQTAMLDNWQRHHSDKLRTAAQSALDLITSSYVHVSHGGPTMADAKKVMDELSAALKEGD